MNSESLRPPNPDCAVCGIATSRIEVDPTRATLNDLVEDVLRLQLGYGEEFTINNEVGTVYDPDLDDNLSKKFEDLGIRNESFLTVIDDEEDNPRVNLQFTISSKVLPEDDKPVVLVTKPDITRRPRKPAIESIGGATSTVDPITNGTSTAKRKRATDEADLDGNTPVKKAQATAPVNEVAETIILDDKGDGAIVIDDD